MKYYRLFLILVSGIAGAVSLATAANTSSYRGEDALILFLIGALCTLNFVYLLQTPTPNSTPNRLAKLASLWLEAKEADLRRRVAAPVRPDT